MKFKKLMTAAAGLMMALSLAACSGGGAGGTGTPAATNAGGGDASAAAGGKVGVSMPTQTSVRRSPARRRTEREATPAGRPQTSWP